ncbi:hypothetical protein E0H73_10355 [Kribbella pittospori]|uniref:Uncharacterized protein n=1 Tax=Kribbella pittospori TaxID=722689 RepID=A0A4R0KUT7_9ACTN|nr:hypothetical protein [Kribbella pittospori]TCC64751.1 hypothetical protein E0H73_10355 [Kribbella pittospori]
MAKKQKKGWTAAGAARAAREHRTTTAEFLRRAPIARIDRAQRLVDAFELHRSHVGGHEEAAALMLITGLGYPETWQPEHWYEIGETVIDDEAVDLAKADLYILSPQMVDVITAAASSLTEDDLTLLRADDLPCRTGVLVLPRPLLVKTPNGNISDDRAFLWRGPIPMSIPDPATGAFVSKPAVKISTYYDRNGPVEADSFREFAAQARAEGTPLPPLMLDGIQCYPFEFVPSSAQLRNLDAWADNARQSGTAQRRWEEEHGYQENVVLGDYVSGDEIDDPDGRFMLRFLYAFWRLCDQSIAQISEAEVNHSARVTAARVQAPPEVRVVELRSARSASSDADDGESLDRWNHRWVVRMHKVRQWYPSEQRHKVIYRGPYVKGPADKPLIGGEIVRSVTR